MRHLTGRDTRSGRQASSTPCAFSPLLPAPPGSRRWAKVFDMARQTFPYKGLAYYREEDAGLFAGRDEEIEKCVHLIRHAWTSLFVVHGLSGCGKSSFLRAGLIPN